MYIYKHSVFKEEPYMATSNLHEIVTDTLSNFDTESIYSKAQKRVHGGLKFIFSAFCSIACFFFVLWCLSPLLCGMLLPKDLQNPAIIVSFLALGSIVYFALIIGFGVNTFSSMATYHVLDKQISQDGFDATAFIESQLSAEWDENEDSNSSIKKKNVKILISTLIREKNWYFKLIKPLVAWGLFLLVGMPMAIAGWLFFYCPIMVGLPVALINIGPILPSFLVGVLTDFSSFISSVQLSIENLTSSITSIIEASFSNLPGSLTTLVAFVTSIEFILATIAMTWIICLISFVLIVTIVLIIWTVTNAIIEKRCRIKWVKANLPDLVEAYRKKILNKKE